MSCPLDTYDHQDQPPQTRVAGEDCILPSYWQQTMPWALLRSYAQALRLPSTSDEGQAKPSSLTGDPAIRIDSLAFHACFTQDLLALIFSILAQPVRFAGVLPNLHLRSDGRKALLAAAMTCNRWARTALPLLQRAKKILFKFLPSVHTYTVPPFIGPTLVALSIDVWTTTDLIVRDASLNRLVALEFLQIVIYGHGAGSPPIRCINALGAMIISAHALRHLKIVTTADINLPLGGMLPQTYRGCLYLSKTTPITLPSHSSSLALCYNDVTVLEAACKHRLVLHNLRRLCLEDGRFWSPTFPITLARSAPELRELWISHRSEDIWLSEDDLGVLLGMTKLEKYGGSVSLRGSEPEVRIGPNLRHLHLISGNASLVEWLASLDIAETRQLETLVLYELDRNGWQSRLARAERKRLTAEFEKLGRNLAEAGVKHRQGDPKGLRNVGP